MLFDVGATVKKILNGELDPKTLTKDQRRNCVEFCRYSLREDLGKISRLLKIDMATVRADLRFVHLAASKYLEHGQISAEIIGELYARLQANYQLALDKKDVAGANKATEMLKQFWQDIGRLTKADTVVQHKGLTILDLARAAAGEEETDSDTVH